ncbi:MAG TPA: endonuclease/exonuclease/phosphatase family protein [Pyrinomonadaceae bacterium]|nr:endonuclease/exonuclease/phosphatase family protein [Pyrinomonadaceae bacterium]
MFASCVLSPSRATPASDDLKTSAGASGLLETGGGAKASPPSPAPPEIKIVSYNIRWRGGDELRALIEVLRDDAEIGGAAIIGLQEVDRNKKRTDHINTARVMAEALGMYYAWAAPPRAKNDVQEDETGVAVLSRYPLTDVERLVLPHEGPGGRRRAGIGVTARVGASDVRVYSLHAETRLAMEKKMEQLGAALDDLKRYPKIKRAVVVGDFNTIKAKDVQGARRVFTKADFVTPFADDRATWKTFIIELKLDGFWLRGLEPVGSGIVRRVKFSDHWPMWVTAKL